MAVGRKAQSGWSRSRAAGVEYSRAESWSTTTCVPTCPIFSPSVMSMPDDACPRGFVQGVRALNAIDGVNDDIRFDVVPSAVFTNPECGMVGLTEEECKSVVWRSRPARVSSAQMARVSPWAKPRVSAS